MSRPSWDQYFFDIARVVSSRATCPRASIGAVLVKQKRIISSGFNGPASGAPHCPDTAEHLALDHCRDSIHAERNALTNALVPAYGATLYVYGPRKVCPDCADALVLAGVTDIRVQHGPASATLEDVLADVWQWQCGTFPTRSPESISAHLLAEARELAEHPTDRMEMADVLMLLAALARDTGTDLTSAVREKLAICRARAWGRPNAAGYVEHIRDAGAPQPEEVPA